jgi:cytochrome c biogenesis protein CcmG/thiol:disulfide interchange protein DsbE
VGISIVSLLCIGLLTLFGSQLLTPMHNQASAAHSLIGHPAPDFTLAVLSAKAGPASLSKIHLASLEGKPIILNFWASWCDPCKHEAPLLEANWLVLQSRGMLLLGVDFQDTQSNALNFLHTYEITYPNVADSTGSTAIAYGLTGVPETFFLNHQGIIVSKVIGEITEQTLQSNLRLLMRS